MSVRLSPWVGSVVALRLFVFRRVWVVWRPPMSFPLVRTLLCVT